MLFDYLQHVWVYGSGRLKKTKNNVTEVVAVDKDD